MKRCSKCGESRPLDEFYLDSRHLDGRQSRCKPCWREYDQSRLDQRRLQARKRHAANPLRRKDQMLRWAYGISIDQWQALLAAQGGLCAMCGTAPATDVDHDHETGRVRGALCGPCNKSLGHYEKVKATAERYLGAVVVV